MAAPPPQKKQRTGAGPKDDRDATNGDANLPPGRFLDVLLAGKDDEAPVAHLAACMTKRDLGLQLAGVTRSLRDALRATFARWTKNGERMGKALAEREAKEAAARGGAPKAQLDAALAALGPRPGLNWVNHNERHTAQRAWDDRAAPLRSAYGAEVRPKLAAVAAAPRSPHLPDLRAGLALRCLVPWAAGRRPPASCVAEVHLPKRADDGGNDLRCWRVAPPGKLYLVGGLGKKDVVCWDARPRQSAEGKAWDEVEVPNLPTTIQGAAVVAINGKLYVTGGKHGQNWSAVCYVWDPAHRGDGWRRVADMQRRRSRHAAVVLNGRLVVMGGDDFQGDGEFLDSVECYDPDTNTWDYIAPMLTARRNHAAVVCDGRICVIGGWNARGGPLRLCECYNPVENAWQPVASMRRGRSMKPGAAVLDGKLWVAGGWGGGTDLRSMEVYDPKTNTWDTTKADMVNRRRGHGFAVLNGRLHAVGGSGRVSVERYDPLTDRWTLTGEMTLLTRRAFPGFYCERF